MPKITAIKQQRTKGRFNVYLDGRFGFGLPAETLVKAGLSVGQEISKKEIKILRYKDIESKLYNSALRFLSYRPRSEKEVVDYLNKRIATRITRRKGKVILATDYTEILERVISKLKSQNLIDDREFTKWWIEQRQKFRPKGVYVLRQELRQKGVLEEAMAKWLNLPAGKAGGSMVKKNELKGARKAARKKLKKLKCPTTREIRQKLTRFLAYRGFSYETIKLVLDEILKKK